MTKNIKWRVCFRYGSPLMALRACPNLLPSFHVNQTNFSLTALVVPMWIPQVSWNLISRYWCLLVTVPGNSTQLLATSVVQTNPNLSPRPLLQAQERIRSLRILISRLLISTRVRLRNLWKLLFPLTDFIV